MTRDQRPVMKNLVRRPWDRGNLLAVHGVRPWLPPASPRTPPKLFPMCRVVLYTWCLCDEWLEM